MGEKELADHRDARSASPVRSRLSQNPGLEPSNGHSTLVRLTFPLNLAGQRDRYNPPKTSDPATPTVVVFVGV